MAAAATSATLMAVLLPFDFSLLLLDEKSTGS
jgi:hypothetical protein